MATPNVGILTTAGKALIDKVNSGQVKISFSKIVFSSMDNSQLSDMQVKALTAIAPQEVVVSSPETTLDTNSGETRIRATGTNEKLADGVYVKTYGVFAKDDKGSEILYGVTVSPNPNYFPAYDGVTPQAVTYSYKTVIQETSNITMTNSNDVYASQEDLTEALQPYTKTVDVNQQLDKKVNIADMRKPASDVAGIEEVNAKQDKIGYTPADDSKVVHSTVNQLNSTDMNTVLTTGFYRLISGTNGMPNADAWTIYQVITWSGSNGVQLAYGTNNTVLGIRSWKLIKSVPAFSNWIQLADDSKVVHSTDMRKPASDVAGIEEVNAKQDKIGYTPADDSKVVHSTDMRKPASDVAGIEEVNAKQDKIGYTPADDSKVVHTTDSQIVNALQIRTFTGDFNTSNQTGIYNVPYKAGTYTNAPEGNIAGQMLCINNGNGDAVQIFTDSSQYEWRRHWTGGTSGQWQAWKRIPAIISSDGSINDGVTDIFLTKHGLGVADPVSEYWNSFRNRLKWESRPLCAKGTDFGTFVKSGSVPTGFSIVRDDNTSVNWMVIKESTDWIFGWAIAGSLVARTFAVQSGVYTEQAARAIKVIDDAQAADQARIDKLENAWKLASNEADAKSKSASASGLYYTEE